MSSYYSDVDALGIDERNGPGPFDAIVQQEPPPASLQPEPFDTDNPRAVSVNQRSARHWSGKTFNVDGTKVAHLLGFQRGRKTFLVNVPATAGAGVYIDEQDSTLDSLGTLAGFYIPVGGSLAVDTEGDVYAISATAGTDTTVCLATTWG